MPPDDSDIGAYRCNLCRDSPVELRPVCVSNRDKIPLLCSECSMRLEAAGRIDRERDREVFGYGARAWTRVEEQ